jgi:drug/metabolite transporter (DMT)-like permease
MLVCAALLWATGSWLSQRIEMPRSVWGSSVYQMIAAGLVLSVLGTALGEARALDVSRFTTESLLGLAYLVVFGSLVAFSAYTWLLQNAPVSLVSTYAYVNPVIAVFLGTLFLAEPITPTMIAGAALILAAVAFILSRLNRARVAARAAEKAA